MKINWSKKILKNYKNKDDLYNLDKWEEYKKIILEFLQECINFLKNLDKWEEYLIFSVVFFDKIILEYLQECINFGVKKFYLILFKNNLFKIKIFIFLERFEILLKFSPQ